MTDIVDFVKCRLDEDERIARSVQDNSAPWTGQWKVDSEHALRTYNDWVLASHHPEPFRPGFLAHVARHDPARVLRGVEAKRRLVELHVKDDVYWVEGEDSELALTIDVCSTCMTGRSCDHCIDRDERAMFTWPCQHLRLLASEWADHPDYRHEEWKP